LHIKNRRHLITSGELEVHERNSSDYELTSSRREWNAVSPLVNSSWRVHYFNGTRCFGDYWYSFV